MVPLSTKIISAQPGFFVIDEATVVEDSRSDRKIAEKGLPIIAWKIETHRKEHSPSDVFIDCIPITSEGDQEDCVGILNPDGTAVHIGSGHYESLADFQKEYNRLYNKN